MTKFQTKHTRSTMSQAGPSISGGYSGTSEPVSVALLGCGAISELYYAPALRELEKVGLAQVKFLLDPNLQRVAALQAFFPNAKPLDNLKLLARTGVGLAIVASPVRFHCEQTIAALEAGAGVLCEKPMAATVAECEQMCRVAHQAGRPLAVGLFRRFFPAARTIREILDSGLLGSARSFEFTEGGSFNWPAQSASFFQKSSAQGGVLIDIGVHVLDLLLWWLGVPDHFEYEDDAMGGLEANCRLRLSYADGLHGQVRLSRDWQLSNRYFIAFEKGWLSWNVGQAEKLQIGLNGSSFALDSQVHHQVDRNCLPTIGEVGSSYAESFIDQLRNVLEAIQGGVPLRVDAVEGIRSLKLIEECYRRRTLMAMPWFDSQEVEQARSLGAQP